MKERKVCTRTGGMNSTARRGKIKNAIASVEHAAKIIKKDIHLFRPPASPCIRPEYSMSVNFYVCVALIRCKKKEIRRPGGYHQQQNKYLCQIRRELYSESTLETGSRVGILDSKFTTSEIERSAVICIVGHGYPAAVGVCIREESARVEALVVHERLTMASRVRLVEASAGVALRVQRAGR